MRKKHINLCNPFKYDLRCALFLPSFLCENELNTTERGAVEVIIERATEIIILKPLNHFYQAKLNCQFLFTLSEKNLVCLGSSI